MKRSLTRRVSFFVPMLTAALIVVGWRAASAGPCISDGQTCRTDQSCCSGVCGKSTKKSFGTCCTPTTCAAADANCGTIADGCGGTLDCGTCTLPETCGGGGAPNVCGVTQCCVLSSPMGAFETCMVEAPAQCAAQGGITQGPGTCSPNPCPTLPVCGNGTIDPGEACDGGPFCSSTCRVMLGSECCERSDASGVCSGSFLATGFSAAFVCLSELGGTRFQWSAPPAGGEPCPSGVVFPFVTAGPCGPPATFPPTSFCCNPPVGSTFTCVETIASDVAELSSWLAFQCNYNGTYPAVVGHCLQPTIPGLLCAPGT